MVMRITLGFATPGFEVLVCESVCEPLVRGCVFGEVARAEPVCAYAVDATAIANKNGRAEQKAGKRRNMRLSGRWLLRAPRLLVCLGGQSFGVQCFGQGCMHCPLLRIQFDRAA